MTTAAGAQAEREGSAHLSRSCAAAAIRATGRRAAALRADLLDLDACEALVGRAAEALSSKRAKALSIR